MKSGDRCFVGTRKGLFCLERKSGKLAIEGTAFLGAPVSMVLVDPRDGAVYAAVKHGHFGAKIHRSKDGGATFEELAAPAFPPKPEGLSDKDPMRNTERKWSLELIWSLEVGGAAGELWCGTIPGGLFHSTDSGASWQLVRSLWDHPSRAKWFGGGYDDPGIHSILVDPRDPRRLVLGVSCGGVWLTEDGGETWSLRTQGMYASYMPPPQAGEPDIQDPHRLAWCTAHPEVLWCQHHCSAFRSEDAGTTWTELTALAPSLFGFAVAACPQDPKTAWFVPAIKDEVRIPVDGKLVVARTTSGGKSFDVFSKGLPDKHAYDLVYRHGLDVDDGGGTLVMGSTTGSLWSSSDGGESWETVSQHLPPIYCVRWG
jgi:photosystem II stability/assembly factor-like uncharacterized protein